MRRLLLIDVEPDEYVLAIRAAKIMERDHAGEVRPFRNFVAIAFENGVTFACWQTKTQRTVRQVRGGDNAAD